MEANGVPRVPGAPIMAGKIMRAGASFAALGLLALAGCMDQDPFGLSTRKIRGPYELEQWEDGTTYYLRGPSHLAHEAWGAIEGTVGRLGWSGDTILVWQNDCGSGAGWRVVDAKTRVISPLVSQERIDRDPMLAGIPIYTAADAWQRLR